MPEPTERETMKVTWLESPTLILRRLSPWPRRALGGELVVGPNGVGHFAAGWSPDDRIAFTLEDALILDPTLPRGRIQIAGGGDWQEVAAGVNANGTVRDKIPALTAIPAGTYRVRMTYSGRFKRWLPELMDVPMFTAIRFHGANTVNDVEGCIGVGDTQVSATRIARCAPALARVVRIVEWAERNGGCWMEITNPGGTT